MGVFLRNKILLYWLEICLFSYVYVYKALLLVKLFPNNLWVQTEVGLDRGEHKHAQSYGLLLSPGPFGKTLSTAAVRKAVMMWQPIQNKKKKKKKGRRDPVTSSGGRRGRCVRKMYHVGQMWFLGPTSYYSSWESVSVCPVSYTYLINHTLYTYNSVP